MRIGFGFDLHRIRRSPKGGVLIVAGVKISAPYKVEAHSDGDLVFHALSDAISSAMGGPDIGEKFPPNEAKTLNMDSKKILEWAMKLAGQKFSLVNSVSLVIAAEEPKLTPFRKRIQEALAVVLKIPTDRVGISFKTFEGLPISNEAIACWATCLLEEK